MADSLLPLFDMIINFVMLLIFIRFMLQFSGLERSHPYAEPAYKTTGVVDIFERIFPTVGNGRVSLAAIVLLLLLKLIDLSGNAALTGVSLSPIRLFFEGTLALIISFLSALRYLIIASIVVSWIIVLSQKMHPIYELIVQMAEPVLAPFRRIIPNFGMLDLSPIAAIFGLLILEMIVKAIASGLLPMIS